MSSQHNGGRKTGRKPTTIQRLNYRSYYALLFHLSQITLRVMWTQLMPTWPISPLNRRFKHWFPRLTYLVSSPGFMAITLPSITAIAPRVAAATKSLCTCKKPPYNVHYRITQHSKCSKQDGWQNKINTPVIPSTCLLTVSLHIFHIYFVSRQLSATCYCSKLRQVATFLDQSPYFCQLANYFIRPALRSRRISPPTCM